MHGIDPVEPPPFLPQIVQMISLHHRWIKYHLHFLLADFPLSDFPCHISPLPCISITVARS